MSKKMRVLVLGVFALSFFLWKSHPATAQSALADFEAVDTYIATQMQDLGIPGAALVIVQGERIVHLRAFGVANATGRAVTPQTPFFTGSTGKSFTALAMMQLVEAGKVNLDAPVQTYLPWFRLADQKASARITVRHLLNQVSGIPQWIGQTKVADTDPSERAIENHVRALASVQPIAQPGERYEYSSSNYVTLGMIIQAVTGQSYESYIAEHIFKPLDMRNSFTSKTVAQQQGLAVGYLQWFGIPVASPNLPFTRNSLPAGYLNFSAEDFGHYLIAQLNEGRYQNIAVLSPAGIAEMHQPAVHVPDSTDYYGMGWEVRQFENVPVVAHNGAVPGYSAGMFLVKDRKLGVALLTNQYDVMFSGRTGRVPGNIVRLLLGQTPIPGQEALLNQIVYAVVMLIPLLYLIAITTTWRRIRYWHLDLPRRTRFQLARFIAPPLLWNIAVAYLLLIFLPSNFGANISAVLLFKPDVGWAIIVGGGLAIAWGIARTVLVLWMWVTARKKNVVLVIA